MSRVPWEILLALPKMCTILINFVEKLQIVKLIAKIVFFTYSQASIIWNFIEKLEGKNQYPLKLKWNNKSDKTERKFMISHESVNKENWWLWMNGINPTFSMQAPILSQLNRPELELHHQPQPHQPLSPFPSSSECVPGEIKIVLNCERMQ